MKTKEELNVLKEEIESLNRQLLGLTDEELAQVAGGVELDPGKPLLKLDLNSTRRGKDSCPVDTLK